MGNHDSLFSPRIVVAEVPIERPLQPGALWGHARFSRSLPSMVGMAGNSRAGLLFLWGRVG